MKYSRLLWWCAFALSFVPRLASADDGSLADWAQRRVEIGILRPLAALSSSRFSRSRPPPHERRVRISQATLSRDKQGREFVPFAIDVRYGDNWRENDIIGCAYRATGSLFVKRGESYFPASFLLGADVNAVQGACEIAPPRS